MTNVAITRLPYHELYWRIKIGGKQETGYECFYRGTREEAIDALEKVLLVMQHMPEQEIELGAPITGKS